jgi:hypothetical protein
MIGCEFEMTPRFMDSLADGLSGVGFVSKPGSLMVLQEIVLFNEYNKNTILQ